MGVLSDHVLRTRTTYSAGNPERLGIEPFAEHTKENGRPSHGLSCYGYDLRLGDKFKRLSAEECRKLGIEYVGPGMDIPAVCYKGWTGSELVLHPGGFVLGASVEWVRVPRDCLGLVLCKSTWARLGICLNMTPLEAEWQGHVTLEIANFGPMPVRIQAGDGIGQMVFLLGVGSCETSYADRAGGGTYQNQGDAPVPAKA